MNAFIPGERLRVEASARGPLDGLRFAVKDLIDVAGTRTGGGNPDWLRTQVPAARHAVCVEQLLASGASIDGKTITDELAYSLEGANHHYGTPVNPRWPDALPGGSSSGSASAVASGMVDFALGTDTGGSVRVPAAFCGIWGMRPTHGAISLDGVLPFAPGFDTVGWFARSADMLSAVGGVLLPDSASSTEQKCWLRVHEAFAMRAKTQPDDAARLEAIARSFGATSEIAVASEEWLGCYQALQDAEIDASLGSWISAARPLFGPAIASRFARLDIYDRTKTAIWHATRARLNEKLEALMQNTLLVMPTAPLALLSKDAPQDEIGRFYQDALTVNAIAAIGGLPQITMPFVDEIDRPLALSIIGARGDDTVLLNIARGLATTYARLDGSLSMPPHHSLSTPERPIA